MSSLKDGTGTEEPLFHRMSSNQHGETSCHIHMAEAVRLFSRTHLTGPLFLFATTVVKPNSSRLPAKESTQRSREHKMVIPLSPMLANDRDTAMFAPRAGNTVIIAAERMSDIALSVLMLSFSDTGEAYIQQLTIYSHATCISKQITLFSGCSTQKPRPINPGETHESRSIPRNE